MSEAAAEVNVDEILADPKMLAFLEQYGAKFMVSALPMDVRDNANAKYFYLYIERKSPGRWAVSELGGEVLSRTGLWRYEGLPSSRTDKFKEVTRFPLIEAFKLAQREAARITIGNGWTVKSITEDIRQRKAEKVAAEAAGEAFNA